MSVISFLNKKQKVMRNLIDILNELYGQPQWLVAPKKGQSTDTILVKWIDEFGDYEASDLIKAANKLYQWHKLKSYPTIAHINMALGSVEKPVENSALQVQRYTCLEADLMRRDIKLGKRFFTLPHYRRSVNYILDVVLLNEIGNYDYYAFEESCKSKGEINYPRLRGLKARRAEELGLFDKHMDDLLVKSYNGEMKWK